MSPIEQLARALIEARHDLDRILHALASALTSSLCDDCAIRFPEGTAVLPPSRPHRIDSRDVLLANIDVFPPAGVHSFDTAARATTELPKSFAPYIARVGLRGLVVTSLSTTPSATVLATRDGSRPPFSHEEAAAIQDCVDLASIAADGAMQLANERAGVAVEHERISGFHDELIRIVGHDLRSPLGAIMIGTEMLAIARDPTVAVRRIVSFTKRLSRIVDHVVDLTRTRLGGGIPLARCYTRLAPLVQAAVTEVAMAHPQHTIVLRKADDVRGTWDPDRLTQVAMALLTNAVQYGRERGAIEVELTHEAGIATFHVHNDLLDRPVSSSAMATMFDAYRRGSDDVHIGTGIGLSLYLAQQITHAHGGTIAVESSSAGTTFRVALPGATLAA